MADRVGKKLGNYQLIRFLGSGPFAEVYLGEHIYLHTLATVKVLHPDVPPDRMDLFLIEARITAKLVHPNITQIPDFGVEGDTSFLVTTYAYHGSILQRHPSGSHLPLAIVLSYTKQLASALQYVHDQGFIHREVTPMNILLGSNNDILLGDFGNAIAAEKVGDDLSFVGTPAYAAPEQIKGEPCFASDQYALGVVAYEWLSGIRPFDGSTLLEIAMKHLNDPPPPFKKELNIPPQVEQVVMKALAKEPQQRFPTIQSFADAFERACQPEPQHAASPLAKKSFEVFFSYSHKDEALRDELEMQLSLLKQQGFITSWYHRKISAGTEWAKEIDTHLNTAQIILLLISPDFMASDYCYNIEVKRALERHEAGKALVIPVILRSVDWKNAPFSKLQVLPTNARPVMSWRNRAEAFLDVATGIRKAVEELTQNP